NQRAVYIWRLGQALDSTSCPPDNWVDCAIEYIRENRKPGEPDDNKGSHGPSKPCELVLTIPAWRPAPNERREKQQMASEVLSEFRSYGYEDVRRIIVRDFALDDPDLWAYIVDRNGRGEVLGCRFERERQPHCGWHMFGQAPVKELKR